MKNIVLPSSPILHSSVKIVYDHYRNKQKAFILVIINQSFEQIIKTGILSEVLNNLNLNLEYIGLEVFSTISPKDKINIFKVKNLGGIGRSVWSLELENE